MFYALTVNADHIITGVHESMNPIAADAFSANPDLSEDTVVVIESPAEFDSFVDIRCYNEDGTRKPLVWCIENGFMPMPPNKEIINSELVDKEIPAEEQPQTLKEYLDEQFEAVRQENMTTQKASTVMFRALAQTDVITPADALDNAGMFGLWADRVSTDVKVGEYLRHEDGLYRVKQAHKIQAHYPPSTATAALYSKVTMPGEVPDWNAGSWAKGVTVSHRGRLWLSMVDNNTWEPGAPGVYDNIWKAVSQ